MPAEFLKAPGKVRAADPSHQAQFDQPKIAFQILFDDGPTRIIQHWESFEVLRDGKRRKFFFDTSAFRRGIGGRMSKDEAKQQALAFAQCIEDRIEIDPDEAGPPPWEE